MAKEKDDLGKTSLNLIRKKIEKIKAGLVTSAREAPKIKRMATGLPDLDYILDGGLPLARLTQIAGADKSGKTTTCYKIIAAAQAQYPDKATLFIDSEGTFDPDRAEMLGVDLDALQLSKPESAEEAFMVMRQFLLTETSAIVLDSVPMCFPDKVMDNDIGSTDVAPVARFLNMELPKMIPYLKRSDTILVFINQLRESVGGMPTWGDNTHIPGGRQLQHFSSLILKMQRKQGIKVSDDEVGQFVKVKIEKSKTGTPKKEALLNLVYERGFVDNEDLERVKKEVRKENLAKEKLRVKNTEEEEDGDTDE